eukprot:4477906-Lingulodinium_polyedra.AAC.1
MLPFHPSGRKFFVICFRQQYMVFRVQAQGAGGSPLGWGRLAALIGRLIQGMFLAEEFLIDIFVDD